MRSEIPPLVNQAVKNPFRFFSLEEIAEMYGFSRNVMTALVQAGAPVIARKMNPYLLMEWLKEHPDSLKARGDN